MEPATRAQWLAHLDLVARQMPGELESARLRLIRDVAAYLRAQLLVQQAGRGDEHRARELRKASSRLLDHPGVDEAWIARWHELVTVIGRPVISREGLAGWLQVDAA